MGEAQLFEVVVAAHDADKRVLRALRRVVDRWNSGRGEGGYFRSMCHDGLVLFVRVE